MKRGGKIFVAILLFSAAVSSLHCQIPNGERDKYTLLTMPYNQRQLTLYRGQFAANAGYKFAVRSQSYDNSGSKVLLTNKGTGSVYHYYFANISYGITDFLEMGAETNYIRHGIRAETATYVSTDATGTKKITVNKLTEVKGFGDILLLAKLRLPIEYKGFDISATGGLFLPSSEYKPSKPSDVKTNVSAANSYSVSYQYNYTNGYGVPVYLISGTVKTRINRFTVEADVSYKTPMTEGKNIRWVGVPVNQEISYYDKTYSYLLSNEFSLNMAFHYQATGWFDMFLNMSWLKTKGGWTEYWGNKYMNPETFVLNLEPGFELQISPSLTIYQVAGFPVAGKNSDAPFYLFTTIRFSNFLFSK